MVLKKMILPALLLLLIGFVGCSRAIVLHPISTQDIQPMKKDEAFTPKKDGYFLSEFYVKEVMQAKVDKANLK